MGRERIDLTLAVLVALGLATIPVTQAQVDAVDDRIAGNETCVQGDTGCYCIEAINGGDDCRDSETNRKCTVAVGSNPSAMRGFICQEPCQLLEERANVTCL